MTKRNVTIQLDEGIVRHAKAAAAKRGMSLSGLVTQQLQELVAADERYETARKTAMAAMANAVDRGGYEWNREELYDR